MNMIFMSKSNYIGLTLVLKMWFGGAEELRRSRWCKHTDKVDTQHNL